jgi:zinc protease
MDSRFYGRQNYISEMDKLLEKTTLQDVNSYVKKMWQTKNMFVTIVTDKSEAPALSKSLLENTPSPMSYSNSLKGVLTPEILSEDKEVEKYPLNIKKVNIVNSNEMFLK